MGLAGGKKTHITSVATAIDTALSGLDPRDVDNQNAIAVLNQMRRLLVTHLPVERSR